MYCISNAYSAWQDDQHRLAQEGNENDMDTHIPFLPPKRAYGQSKRTTGHSRMIVDRHPVVVIMPTPPQAPRLIIIIVMTYPKAIEAEGQSDD